jgi:hypothetical protein
MWGRGVPPSLIQLPFLVHEQGKSIARVVSFEGKERFEEIDKIQDCSDTTGRLCRG